MDKRAEIFRECSIDGTAYFNKIEFVVVPTQDEKPCKHCIFEYKKNSLVRGCPKGEKYPVCFAVERKDRQSVRFVRSGLRDVLKI